MITSRKLGCLLGIALGLAASGVQAQSYDPYYNNDPYNNNNNNDRYDPYDNRNGYDDRYGGRRLVRCESRDHRTNYCNVDVRGGVRLANQLSDHRCIRGSTWGTSARGIWVTDGCRGNFELGSSRGEPRYGYGNSRSGYGDPRSGYGDPRSGYGQVFRCESTDSRTRYCNVETRGGVRLVRQLSRSSCIEGRSWGATRDGVWVTRGCRAEFSVNDRYDRGYGTSRY